MTPEELNRAFGGVEALGRFMEVGTLIAMNCTPMGRAALSGVDLIDSAVAVARAESAGDVGFAIASAVASLPLPGVKMPAPVAATEAVQELKTVTTVSHLAAVGEPDVYAISLSRWKKVADEGRSVTDADRLRAQRLPHERATPGRSMSDTRPARSMSSASRETQSGCGPNRVVPTAGRG